LHDAFVDRPDARRVRSNNGYLTADIGQFLPTGGIPFFHPGFRGQGVLDMAVRWKLALFRPHGHVADTGTVAAVFASVNN
jgi:hypothetical protein